MMFQRDTFVDLWSTGQQFKDMRIDACRQMLSHVNAIHRRLSSTSIDIVVTHFHDLCPVAIANALEIDKVCALYSRWHNSNAQPDTIHNTWHFDLRF